MAGGNGKNGGDDSTEEEDDDVTDDDADYGWGDSSTSGFGDGWSSH